MNVLALVYLRNKMSTRKIRSLQETATVQPAAKTCGTVTRF